MRYLLDTNVCVVHLRSGQAGPISERLQASPAGDVGLCSVVVSELLFGALRSRDPARNLREVDGFAARFDSLPFDDAAAPIHARLRAELAQAGKPIGPHDLMIAAIALAHDLVIVTHNTAEFGRVPGLRVEDWQA